LLLVLSEKRLDQVEVSLIKKIVISPKQAKTKLITQGLLVNFSKKDSSIFLSDIFLM